jgi:hypothetical protein
MTRHGRLPNRTVEPRPIFTLKIEGKRDSSIRSLRWLLKTLLRQHGFRCVEAIEERKDGGRQ